MNIKFQNENSFKLYIEYPIVSIWGFLKKNKELVEEYNGHINNNNNNIEINNENGETLVIKLTNKITDKIKDLKNKNPKSKKGLLKQIIKFSIAGMIFTNPLYANPQHSQLLSGLHNDTEINTILKKAKENPNNFKSDFSKIVDNIDLKNSNSELLKVVKDNINLNFYSDNSKLTEENKQFIKKQILGVISKAINEDIKNLLKIYGYVNKNGEINSEGKEASKLFLDRLFIKIYPTHYDKNISPEENQNSGNKFINCNERNIIIGNGYGGYTRTKDGTNYTIMLAIPGADNISFLKKLKEKNLLKTYLAMIYEIAAHEFGHASKGLVNILNNNCEPLPAISKEEVKKLNNINQFTYPENVAIYFQNKSAPKSFNKLLTNDKSYQIVKEEVSNGILKMDTKTNEKMFKNYINHLKEGQDLMRVIEMGKKIKRFNYINPALATELFEMYQKVSFISEKEYKKDKIDTLTKFWAAINVDILNPKRENSVTYGEYTGMEINGINKDKFVKKLILKPEINSKIFNENNNNEFNDYTPIFQALCFSNQLYSQNLTEHQKKLAYILYYKSTLNNFYNTKIKTNEKTKFFGIFSNNNNNNIGSEFLEYNKNLNNILKEKVNNSMKALNSINSSNSNMTVPYKITKEKNEVQGLNL